MNIKKLYITVCLFAFSFAAVAQSQAEIEKMKQLAVSMGYSQAQVEAVAASVLSGGSYVVPKSSESVSLQREIDRNDTEFGATVPVQIINLPAITSDSLGIFGHELFRNKDLNFVPSYNVPTPENYKLSAGDEIVIDIWGDVISNITAKISPEGCITIPNLGPVYISGQTVVQAEKSLKAYLSKIYSGLAQPEPTTFAKLALGKTKTVSINVVGDVAKPGSYTLPSLSTIASAMYLAGGPSELGTVRNIRLYRNNKLASTLDVYDFILNGKFDSNIRLEDNDVIIVSPYEGVVTVSGAVKRPMKYEVKGGETIADIIDFAGGFSDNAYTGSVHISRISGLKDQHTGATGESFDVPADKFGEFKLQGGDVVKVKTNKNRFKNQIAISGAVWHPGTFSITEEKSTLRDLIQAAGGLQEDAYLERGAITRLDENRLPVHIPFSVQNVILGMENVILKPDDKVEIYSIHSLLPKKVVRIYGEVNNPTRKESFKGESNIYDFKSGMTIADLILAAGGITEYATLSKVEVARRIVGDIVLQDETPKSDTVAQVFHFNLLKNPSDADFKLEPYDIVFVRRNPNYKDQQAVRVIGEVNYPGTYVVEKNNVRLSDIIESADGFKQDAYIKGATLKRTLTKEEYERLVVAKEIAMKQVNDSTAVEEMEIGESYSVAIDLEAAIKNPGSVADVVLRSGDIINVPKFNSTVKISGGVLYPNVVSYVPGKSLNYYLSNAGGIIQGGVKKKTYMVHMNGAVATKGNSGFKVQPGTEIIVPVKDKSNKGQTLASILGIATSTASLAAMVTTIINQVK